MRYRFGELVLDLEASRLDGPAGEIRLRPQAFRLLEVLVESAPRILSQEDLLDRVWGVEHLSPASVKQAVSEVRQALGDDPANPRLIETVHRRGYRFIAPLVAAEPAAVLQKADARHAGTAEPAHRFRRNLVMALVLPSLAGIAGFGFMSRALPQHSALPHSAVTPVASGTGAPAARRTVAILGFKNLSGDPRVAWISGALSEILGFELTAPGRLRVIPGENVARMRRELSLTEETPSPVSLQRIGRNLGTDFVVLGSYLLSEKDLRVQVMVQDVRNGETVAWARESGSPDKLNDLALAAARGVLGALARGEAADPTAQMASLASNAESLRLYSEAQTRLRVWDGSTAVRLLEEEVRIDPRNPFAFDALATAYSYLGFELKAREASRQALALADRVPREVRLSIEGHAHAFHGAWDQAAASYAALWQLHPDDLENGLRLALAQRKGGRTAESLSTVAALRKLAPPAGDDPRIDLAESDGAWQLGDFARSRDGATRSLEKSEARGAVLLAAGARFSRGYALKRLGDNEAALADFRASYDIYQRMGDRGAAGGSLGGESFVLQTQGKVAEARRACEEAIAIFREIGDRAREAKGLNNYAALLNEEGDMSGLAPLFERSLAIKREVGDIQGIALTLVNLGAIFLEKGDVRSARSHLEEGLAISRRLEDAHGIALALRGLARYQTREHRFDDGRAALAEALSLSRRSGDAEGTAQAALALGDLEKKAGRPEPAQAAYRQAIQEFTRIEEPANVATVMINLAEIDAAAGRWDTAGTTYVGVLKLAVGLQSPILEAQSRYGLGLTAARRGDPQSARGEYEKAAALFEKLKEKDEAAKARQALAALTAKL